MTKYLRLSYVPSTIAMVVCLGGQSVSAMQDADNGSVLEEIVVTSTKRETTLQDTPVAVSVTTEAVIEQSRIFDLKDLQSVVPSLRVNQLQNTANTNFIIRGFGNGANNPGIESSVGMFIDGVFRSRTAARIGDLPKIERVEVLRGPQSTLFGKNASAGVVNIVSAAPTFDPEGYVEAGYGNYDNFTGRAYYSNGLSENVAFSLGGGFNFRDGYTEPFDPALESVNDRNRWSARGQLLIEPTDKTTIRIIADYATLDEVCCSITNFQNEGAANVVIALGGNIADADNPFERVAFFSRDPENKIDDYGFSLDISHDFDEFNVTSITAYRVNDSFTDFDADFSTLDLIRNAEDTELNTFTQEIRFTSTGDNRIDWMFGGFLFVEDVEFNSQLNWGADMRTYIDALAGSPALFGVIEATNGFAPGTFFGTQSVIREEFTQDNTSYSLFGNIDFHVTDKLTITGGLNYTQDKKTVTSDQPLIGPWFSLDLTTANGTDILANGQIAAAFDNPANPIFQSFQSIFGLPLNQMTQALIAGGGAGPQAQAGYLQGFFPAIQQGVITNLQALQFTPPFVSLPNAVEDGRTNDDDLTWTLRATYEFSENVTAYVSAATGFKSSSWNLSRNAQPFASDGTALAGAGLLPASFQGRFGTRFAGPEEATVYEIGLKARFPRGAFNLAVFDQSIEGFQSNVFVGSGFQLANAGEQSTKGFEIDATWQPIDPLVLTFAVTYLDAEYDSFVNGPGPNNTTVDLSGQRPAGIPEWATSASFVYNFEIGAAEAFIRGDWQYESNVQTNEVFTVTTGAEQPFREISTVNASAGVSWENGWSAQLWARNLFNDTYVNTVFPGVLQAGVIAGYINPPRTYGFSVRKSF